MSQQPNIFLFSSILGAVFLLLDAYVIGHWRAYVLRHSLNRWWYRAVVLLSIVMMGLYWTVVLRRHFFRLDGFEVVLFGIVTLWYLPKIGIAPVLLVRDLFQLVRKISWTRTKSSDTSNNVPPEDSRRAFLGKAAWGMASVPYVLVGNGMWRTIYDFQVIEVDVPISNLPRSFDGIRIAQISDIHAGSFPDHRPFQEVRRLIAASKADLLTITGDFVNATPSELSLITAEMQKLKAPLGVIASLGNHDHYNTPQQHQELIRTIRSTGIDLLINEHRTITVGGSSIVVAGTDNTGFKQNFARIDKALRGTEEDQTTILLAHDPTYWDAAIRGSQPVNLMLSGHTHGGQFGVQLLGFEWSPAQYVYKQWAGLYAEADQYLYVNRGIGTVGPPLRIGIPPEITIFTLRAASISDRLA